MEINKRNIRTYAANVVSLLWFYAAGSKWFAYNHFENAMHKQELSPPMEELLIYVLPLVEVSIAVMLLFRQTIGLGLYASAGLFLIFTIYILLILLKVFGRIPCACGGLIEQLGWTFHLGFNLAFLALTLTTIFIHQRKERGDKQ